VVLRATGTYVCNGVCIANNECCERGTDSNPLPGCPAARSKCYKVSDEDAVCVCDTNDPACCAAATGVTGNIGDECPLDDNSPTNAVCTEGADDSDTDGKCGCGAGKCGGGCVAVCTCGGFTLNPVWLSGSVASVACPTAKCGRGALQRHTQPAWRCCLWPPSHPPTARAGWVARSLLVAA
jgi:hypothetical protein